MVFMWMYIPTTKTFNMCSPKRVESSTKKMVETLEDYKMSVLYHPSKANVVADALALMNIESVSHVEGGNKDLVKDFHRLAWLGVQLEDSQMVVLWSTITPNHL